MQTSHTGSPPRQQPAERARTRRSLRIAAADRSR